jgi:hypothetical protein
MCYKGVLPSQMVDLVDPYTAYCFNEAMTYIIARLEKGDKPIKKINDKGNKESLDSKRYSSFSALYDKYDN